MIIGLKSCQNAADNHPAAEYVFGKVSLHGRKAQLILRTAMVGVFVMARLIPLTPVTNVIIVMHAIRQLLLKECSADL